MTARIPFRMLAPLALGAVFAHAAPQATPPESPAPESKPQPVTAGELRADAKIRLYVARHGVYKNITAEQMGEIATAGFNIFGHRWGPGNPGEVRRTARLARSAGLAYAPWIRASLRQAPDNPAKRIVWASGAVQPLHAPLTPELWDYLEKWLLFYARKSTETPVLGAMLDFENYAENKQGNLYPVSYDVYSLRKFAAEHEVPDPPDDLKPGEARSWYQTRTASESEWANYPEWFGERFRNNWRSLRRKIDAINPEFLIMGYLNPSLTGKYASAEMSTPEAPYVVVAADYGRPDSSFTEAMSLKIDKRRIQRRVEDWNRRGDVNVLVTSGVLPGHRGADPEYSAKQMVLAAELADGYWVWDEGKGEDRTAWFDWFAKANADIAAGDYALPCKPRKTPEPRPDFNPEFPDRVQIALSGDMRGGFRKYFEDRLGAYEVHTLSGLEVGYLAGFDLIVLQDYGLPPETEDAREQVFEAFREYVENGGSLLLAHRTIIGFEELFPEIVRDTAPPEAAEGHVKDDHRVSHRKQHVVTGIEGFHSGLKDDSYNAHYKPHVPLLPGDRGRVLLENRFGQAVLVVGEYGDGRVAITGNHLGRRKAMSGDEARFYRNVVESLTWPQKKEHSTDEENAAQNDEN